MVDGRGLDDAEAAHESDLARAGLPRKPCWLAVHREIRGSPVMRRVHDFLAEAIAAALDATEHRSP